MDELLPTDSENSERIALDFYANEFNQAIAVTQPNSLSDKVVKKAKEKGIVWHKVYGTGKLLSMKGDKAEILFDRDHRRITLNMAYCIEKGILRTEQEKGR